MKEREVWFGLNETAQIGWKTLQAVALAVKDVSTLPDMSESEVLRLPLPPNKRSLVYQGSRKAFIESRIALYDQLGYRYIARSDAHYPALLQHMPEPPWVLYYKGDLSRLTLQMLGIVGTRLPTAYGKRVAYQFAKQLSELGWCMVSGMARGIDSQAHVGALEGIGKTIAVLGTPIDYIYPPENKRLYEQVEAEGLILSEYALGTVMHKGMFPRRNRIIAGLSLGVLVVEADEQSGSLITAELAHDMSREVFAVPGPITSSKSKGTHALIKNNTGSLVTGPRDIYDHYEYMKPVHTSIGTLFPELDQPALQVSQDEAKVLAYLNADPTSFDELYELTQFDFGHLHSVLISLLMTNKIQQHAGSSYVRI
jgi:DNA processing protein